MFEKTKQFCDTLLDMGMPGFDLAVFQGGKCILRYMNGYSDLENKVKMQGNERYNIYSCSKLITCTAALQLWERGKFSLEDKLSDYIPEFGEMMVKTDDGVKKAENPILIKHLFEMTAGLSYDVASPQIVKCQEETGGKCPTVQMAKYLAKEPLLFEPGTLWEYSLCHDVLAALVEVVSGEKFQDYVKKDIFDVAQMIDSTFMLPEEELDTLAQQYVYEDDAPKKIDKTIYKYKLGTEYASGGAGGISTVDDYIKFLEALRTGKLLKPETVQLMITPRLTQEQNKNNWTQHSHGYGLGVRCPKGLQNYTDFGWGGAAGAFIAVDLENELSLYFGSHVIGSRAQGVRAMLYRFVRAELIDLPDLKNIREEMKDLYDYHATY